MNRLATLLLVGGLLALGPIGCGDDEESDGGSAAEETAPAVKSPAESAPKAGGSTVAISMKNTKYVPQDATVKVGSTVVWTNDDSFPHTVTKEGGPGEDFDSGNVSGGAKFETKVTKPGKIDYVCTIHPGQKGTLTVE
jgi:plastocyanin